MHKFVTIPSSAGGYPLFCRDKGEGHPVILLHGFAEDSGIWDNQLNALNAACRLILPDLPGSGRSSASDGEWPSCNRIAASPTAFL